MEPQRRVQVVLGEAERADGLLRFVLEAEGFDLVGMASSDEELARVLRGAHPSVVVLDGGISAAAALDARERVGDAALVVVWPDGVSAVIAEERVEPSMVIEELGDAVRRAADRILTPIEPVVVPEAEADEPVVIVDAVLPDPSPPPPTRRRRGRRMQTLIAAATWFLVLTSLAAIATAVPQVVNTLRRGATEHPSPMTTPDPTRRVDEPSDGPSTETPEEGQQNRCDDAVNGNANDRSNGNGVRAQGCPSGGRGAGTGNQGGRPEDPGSQGNGGSSGNSGSNGGPPADEEATGDDVSHGHSDEEHGGGQGQGQSSGDEQHGRAGEAGKSDQHG